MLNLTQLNSGVSVIINTLCVERFQFFLTSFASIDPSSPSTCNSCNAVWSARISLTGRRVGHWVEWNSHHETEVQFLRLADQSRPARRCGRIGRGGQTFSWPRLYYYELVHHRRRNYFSSHLALFYFYMWTPWHHLASHNFGPH